jgi:hypothetical protein
MRRRLGLQLVEERVQSNELEVIVLYQAGLHIGMGAF